jgi:hypothetical protein
MFAAEVNRNTSCAGPVAKHALVWVPLVVAAAAGWVIVLIRWQYNHQLYHWHLLLSVNVPAGCKATPETCVVYAPPLGKLTVYGDVPPLG